MRWQSAPRCCVSPCGAGESRGGRVGRHRAPNGACCRGGSRHGGTWHCGARHCRTWHSRHACSMHSSRCAGRARHRARRGTGGCTGSTRLLLLSNGSCLLSPRAAARQPEACKGDDEAQTRARKRESQHGTLSEDRDSERPSPATADREFRETGVADREPTAGADLAILPRRPAFRKDFSVETQGVAGNSGGPANTEKILGGGRSFTAARPAGRPGVRTPTG